MRFGKGKDMKKGAIFSLITFLVFILVLTSGCAKKEETFGKEITIEETTKLTDIFSNPGKYNGKRGKVEGKIDTECTTGCKFDVKDGTVKIHVDIASAGLTIPQRVGSKVVIEGKVVDRGYKIEIVGEGVKIK